MYLHNTGLSELLSVTMAMVYIGPVNVGVFYWFVDMGMVSFSAAGIDDSNGHPVVG